MNLSGFLRILTAWIFMICLISCSSPYVKKSSFDGQIKDIQYWNLEWDKEEHSTQQKIDSGLDDDNRTQYEHEVYCQAYVEIVHQELRLLDSITFAENFPHEGVIKFKLSGTRPLPDVRVDSTGRADYLRHSEEIKIINESSVSFSGDGVARALGLADPDRVYRVELNFFSISGKFLGTVFIGKDVEDKIKPWQVADVILEILRKKD